MGRFLTILVLALIACVSCDEHTKQYKEGEEVIIWVNKVGPLLNPQETYMYYSLPYCPPQKDVEHKESLGEALQGYELRKSRMTIFFKAEEQKKSLCQKQLTSEEVEQFRYAIVHQYWYQLFIDDLPVWGMVGELVPDPSGAEDKIYIYTHNKYSFTYNQDRVIEVNLTSENPVPLQPGVNIEFSYSASWRPTDITFDKRFRKYLDYNFFEHQIHWFSIFNSFMMVIFLVGLVSMILMRTLKKDFARYSKNREDSEDDPDVGEESGWKQVHGDVFRPPQHLVAFSALIGTGQHMGVVSFVVIILAILMEYYEDRGTGVTVFVLAYCFLSIVAGYSSGGYYARNDGKHWIQTFLLTAGFFPGLCFAVAFLLNFIAVAYDSLASIPPGTMFVMLVLWLCVATPLTLVGTVIGRNWSGTADNPCRITPVPRPIPEKKWYLHPLMNIVLGGILPFGSIFIEMYFIFTSFWHYKYYYVYGFMLLVFVILVIVSVCITIVSTYFLLNSEDYRWQWVAFLSSASTAGYVFLYSIYYFIAKTKMSGFFQTAFYFGYTAMFCLGLALLTGSIGFLGTTVFVKKIYHNIKID